MVPDLRYETIPPYLADKKAALGRQWGQWKEWAGTQTRLPGDLNLEQSAVGMFGSSYEITFLNSLYRITQKQLRDSELTGDQREVLQRQAVSEYNQFLTKTDPTQNTAFNWGRTTQDFHALTLEEIVSWDVEPGAVYGKNQASGSLIANIARVNPGLVRPHEYMSVFDEGLRRFVKGNFAWIGEEMGSSLTDVDRYALSIPVIQQANKAALRSSVEDHMTNFMRSEIYFEKTDLLNKSWNERHGPIYARLGYLEALNAAASEVWESMDPVARRRQDVLTTVFFSRFKGHHAKPLFKLMLYDLRIGEVDKAEGELEFVMGLNPGIFPEWRVREVLGEDYDRDPQNKDYGASAKGYVTLKRGEFERMITDNRGKVFNQSNRGNMPTKEETKITVLGMEKGKVFLVNNEGKERTMDLSRFVDKYYLV